MEDRELAWRVEEACLNAWPAPRQLMLGGWLLRAAGGPTRRTNSVNPLRGGPFDPLPVLGAAERIYRALGQPILFRVPAIAEGMAERLAGAGYVAEGETCTLHAALGGRRFAADPAVELGAAPGEAWHAFRSRVAGADAAGDRACRATIEAMLLPRVFAAARGEGGIAAIGCGILCGDLLVVETVATDPAARRRGFGRRTVAALMRWAAEAGASAACLQVAADNEPGRALYAALGFDRELYRYHYRRKDQAPSNDKVIA